MVNDWTALAWLALLTGPLLVLERWLSRHLQGLGLLLSGSQEMATLLHYLVLLPGIVLHELSHVVAARLVGVKTKKVSLGPTTKRGGSIRFGAVVVGRSDPIRESWIGLAPLLTGCAAILLLARWQFGIESLPPLQAGAFLQRLPAYLRSPDAWLWLYVIFAISNAMMPSESDREPWLPVLVFLALIAATLYVSGLVPRILPALQRWTTTAVTYLALAFGLTVGADVPFAVLILALEKLGERILGRHVEY